MTIKVLRFIVTAVVVWLSAASAWAMVVQGTFKGTAYDSRIDATSPTPGNFDGELVTGSFRFDTAGLLPPEANEPGFYWGFVQPGALELVFNAAGRAVAFGGMPDEPDAVFATNDTTGQSLELYPNYLTPYYKAALQLIGPLFDGVDLTTLHPGDVDLANSFAYFFAGRDFGASIALTEVTFTGHQIPEPASVWLVLTGLLWMLGATRRRASKPE